MNNLQLIDTHAHLYLAEFAEDRVALLQRAKEAGVTRCYLPGIDSSEVDNLLSLEAAFPEQCKAMMGLHPCYVKDNYKQELQLVLDWLSKRPFAAVGEIGLDFYWDKTFVAQQQAAFHQQIEWALQYNLPIVIHSREAMAACIDIVRSHQKGTLRGIFHCFTGTLEEAQQVIDLGFYLGIGGVLTYKKAAIAEVVKQLPLEAMVLETDAPYLTPVPFRGKRNESSYIKYVAEKLADLKETSLEEVAGITTANAQKIFGA